MIIEENWDFSLRSYSPYFSEIGNPEIVKNSPSKGMKVIPWTVEYY